MVPSNIAISELFIFSSGKSNNKTGKEGRDVHQGSHHFLQLSYDQTKQSEILMGPHRIYMTAGMCPPKAPDSKNAALHERTLGSDLETN